MKTILKFTGLTTMLVATALMTGCGTFNQVRMQSGSFEFLKQQKTVNVEYDYEGMRVGKYNKKSVSEQEYVDKKVAARNQKVPGSGDAWRKAWVNDRTARFQPKFEELLTKRCREGNNQIEFGSHRDAPYTLVLKTQYLEPGYNVGISAQPALLTADAVFVETQNRANRVAAVSMVNMIGRDAMGFDFDAAWRMQESYAKGGKELGNLIKKKVK